MDDTLDWRCPLGSFGVRVLGFNLFLGPRPLLAGGNEGVKPVLS